MKTYYSVSGSVTYRSKDKRGNVSAVTHQVPTFFLDPNVQGINSDGQAEKVARQIIMPVAQEGVVVTVFVMRHDAPKILEDVLKPADVFPTEVA